MDAQGWRWGQQSRTIRTRIRCKSAQRRYVVEHIKAAPVGGDHQIIAVDLDIPHRGRRKARGQNLPMVALIK